MRIESVAITNQGLVREMLREIRHRAEDEGENLTSPIIRAFEAGVTMGEIAGALAFIIWRIAKDKAINLHGQDFVYDSDEQRMAVIVEYLIFQLQIVDRLARDRLGLAEITAMVLRSGGSNSTSLPGARTVVPIGTSNAQRRATISPGTAR